MNYIGYDAEKERWEAFQYSGDKPTCESTGYAKIEEPFDTLDEAEETAQVNN